MHVLLSCAVGGEENSKYLSSVNTPYLHNSCSEYSRKSKFV